MTTEQKMRAARMRALAMRKRGIRPGLSANRLPEVKAVDIPGGAGDLMSTTEIITVLNLVQVGSSFYNRVGRRIEMKSLTLRGVFTPLTQTGSGFGRVLVIYDAQTNGAFPALADILQTTSQTGANTNSVFSGLNLNYRARFRILRDLYIALPAQTVAGGQITNPGYTDDTSDFPRLNMFIPLKGLETQYRADSNPAVIGDVATGGLFLVTFGNITAANSGWTLLWQARLRYNDN